MAGDGNQAHEEAHGLEPREYVIVGVILTVITAVELVVSYSDMGALLVPALLVLSAVKFGAVVAFFMHLRFDAIIFNRLFIGPLVLAGALLLSLVSIFWTNPTALGG